MLMFLAKAAPNKIERPAVYNLVHWYSLFQENFYSLILEKGCIWKQAEWLRHNAQTFIQKSPVFFHLVL